VPQSARDAVVRHMEDLGFETLHAQTSFSNHLRGRDRVDFIYVNDATADLVLDAAVRRPVRDGLVVPVAAPEYLAMMKFLAVKNQPTRDRQDLPDLVFLLRSRSSQDPGVLCEERDVGSLR